MRNKFEIGDVVYGIYEHSFGVVLKEFSDGDLHILFEDGSGGICKKEKFNKTGRHIDLYSLYKEIDDIKNEYDIE